MSGVMEAQEFPDLKPVSGRACLRWGVDAFCFEASLPPEVADSARRLFASWPAGLNAAVLGRWNVTKEGEEWLVSSDAGEVLVRAALPLYAIASLETLGMQALSFAATGLVGLHAALIRGPQGAVAIAGRGTSGKSTLACSLGLVEGWTLLADDSALLRPLAGDNGWEALAGPRRVSVRATSRALLGETFWQAVHETPSLFPTAEGFLFSPSELWPESLRRTGALKAVFLLERQDSALAPGECALISPAQAVLALAPYTYACARSGFGAAMMELAPLCDAVPVYEMKRGALDRMMHAVREHSR